MNIAGREIGYRHPPYIIAEVSCNHGGSLDRALELVELAKWCGADAVKFQCVTPETITLNCSRPEFLIEDGPWKGRNLFELYSLTQTPFHWFPEIKKVADDVGITWFASVFDETAVDLMRELGAPAVKIASFEITDTPLINYAATLDVPVILSTGMASGQEINEAAKALEPYTFEEHAMLHCVSAYPTPVNEANLLRLKFGVKYGFIDGISDHSVGAIIPISATALGACIIEKHFRLSWHGHTEDSAFSLDETGFACMVKDVRDVWVAMQPPPEHVSEDAHKKLRRSLFAVADIKAGEILTLQNVRSIRPGHGARPSAISLFVNRRAVRDIARGEPMAFEMIGE